MSELPFVDLKAQYHAYRVEIDDALQRVIDRASFIMGPEVGELEARLASYTGCRHVVTCANGTDAMQLALMALGVGPGDEVIVPAFTFFATAEVVSLVGATPVFADIAEDTYTLDPSLLAGLLTPRTKAIIPVGLFGQPADMAEIGAVADEHGLAVIEDAAQSFGADYQGRKSCSLSRIGCTSFFPSKPLGCWGDGGAVFTDDEGLAAVLRSLRVHGQSRRYRHDLVGLNSRLDTLQAAVLLVKLGHFEDELAARQERAEGYARLLRDAELKLPVVKGDRTSAWAQYSIRVKGRDRVVARCQESGVPVAIHYPVPLYRQPALAGCVCRPAEFPVSEAVSREILSLPMCAFLRPEAQELVGRLLRRV